MTKARVGDSVGPYRVSEIRKADLVQIKALWENLNQLHLKDSRFFKDHYQNFIFEERIESWKDLPDEDFKVVVVSKEAQLLGYCVASLRGRVGEIESVYLEEPIRNSGIGGEIVRLCLDWLHQKQAKKIVVSVADGHESVIPFYQKLGFQPRLTYLELKE